jgi:hypothetical protein
MWHDLKLIDLNNKLDGEDNKYKFILRKDCCRSKSYGRMNMTKN